MVATNFLGVVILSLWAGAAAFSIDPSVRSNRQQTKVEMTTSRSTRTRRTDQINISRRRIFSSIIPAVTLASAALVAKPQSSFAKDELFKSNPLLNPILEKIRILEQAEADNIQYSGELAPGSPKGRESYAKLLVPILTIQRDLMQIDDLAHMEDGKGLNDADKLLTKPYFEKIGFKKVFNAFGKLCSAAVHVQYGYTCCTEPFHISQRNIVTWIWHTTFLKFCFWHHHVTSHVHEFSG